MADGDARTLVDPAGQFLVLGDHQFLVYGPGGVTDGSETADNNSLARSALFRRSDKTIWKGCD